MVGLHEQEFTEVPDFKLYHISCMISPSPRLPGKHPHAIILIPHQTLNNIALYSVLGRPCQTTSLSLVGSK
jgi:hypothetical protein